MKYLPFILLPPSFNYSSQSTAFFIREFKILYTKIMRKSNIVSRLRKLLSCSDGGPQITSPPIDVDVREEYANAFRTESYIEFWTRVLALNDGLTTQLPVGSTTATRLSSYRLFAEQLLDPTQPTIKRILTSAQLGPSSHSLLSDYFSNTANASLLCSRLLKNIDHLRLKLRPLDQEIRDPKFSHLLKITFPSLENTKFYHERDFKPIIIRLVEFSNTNKNSFVPSIEQVQIIQNGCSKLTKQLEFSRDKARAKLKRVKYFQHSSAGFLVVITVSLTVIVVTHGISLFVAAPGVLVGAIKLAKSRKLAKEVAQLNVAAKGTYTLNRDFDTIGRLVARLNHELEHMRVMMRFCLERKEDRHRAIGEVARQLKQSHMNFSQLLDELEEHLYLCFMTINRARNLVVKEILNSGQLVKTPYV